MILLGPQIINQSESQMQILQEELHVPTLVSQVAIVSRQLKADIILTGQMKDIVNARTLNSK